MKWFFDEFGIYILIIAIAVLCICAVSYVAGDISCEAKTAQIGFDHRYSFFGGCQIEILPNRWIPLENYYFKQE